jgi:hypothetical protein
MYGAVGGAVVDTGGSTHESRYRKCANAVAMR